MTCWTPRREGGRMDFRERERESCPVVLLAYLPSSSISRRGIHLSSIHSS
ncbi:Hypothetical protein FKW44_000282 [Caligus rogercresseyi]|uniref:Uncharacterized protein n=1 Tax=Caligus rogercresseyi TaxID=217165 RepID=A0A7T8KH47_CALRO|nr:Hypothetical protein FKW44_000282 [Caligus rogercresseyi]